MLKQNQIELAATTIKNIRVICFALILGVLIATIIFCLITDWTKINTALNPLVITGVVVGLLLLVQSMVVPGLITRSALAGDVDQSPEQKIMKLAGLVQTKTIIQYAMLEGAAFLNLIFFFVTKNMLSLGIVAGALAVMSFKFPRTDSILEWIDDHMN